MKNRKLVLLSVMLVTAVIMSGCGLGRMIKKYPEVKYEVIPQVLEAHAGKVLVTVKGNIPPKYFHKKAKIDFTPVLKYQGGEYPLRTLILQGEKVKGGEGVVVKKATGGTITYVDSIPFKPEMKASELVVNAKAMLGSKEVFLGNRKLADGVIYTSERVSGEGATSTATHKYTRDIKAQETANLYFEYNRADLNMNVPLNKKQENIDKLKKFVEFVTNDWVSEGIEIVAWASPEGEESLNNELSKNRSKTGEKYIKDQILKALTEKQKKLNPKSKDPVKDNNVYNVTHKGEDWDGFMAALNASNIADKKTIENVIRHQNNVQARQQAIRDMTVVYKEVEEKILPPLRRAVFTCTKKQPSKTDAEISNLSTTNPSALTIEELLYAATLTKDVSTQEKIYQNAINTYPNDYRAYLNLSAIYIEQKKIDEAQKLLDKANTVEPNNGKIMNNMATIAIMKKDYETARNYLKTAQQKGEDVGPSMAVLYIKEGKYKEAVNAFGGTKCKYNLGLAQLLQKDHTAAQATLECAQKNAETYYLLAVLGARLNNLPMLIENLTKACELNPAYKLEAKDDREFLKFFDNSQFQNVIR